MARNGYTYTVFATDATSVTERSTASYPRGKTSSDGTLILGDKRDDSEPTMTTTPTKPSYFIETVGNWPYLTHEEAEQLHAYQVSVKGASDGFSENKTTPSS